MMIHIMFTKMYIFCISELKLLSFKLCDNKLFWNLQLDWA